MVVWFTFPYLKMVESKVWRLNSVIFLRTLQLKYIFEKTQKEFHLGSNSKSSGFNTRHLLKK